MAKSKFPTNYVSAGGGKKKRSNLYLLLNKELLVALLNVFLFTHILDVDCSDYEHIFDTTWRYRE
jgi:hypothetical protein